MSVEMAIMMVIMTLIKKKETETGVQMIIATVVRNIILLVLPPTRSCKHITRHPLERTAARARFAQALVDGAQRAER